MHAIAGMKHRGQQLLFCLGLKECGDNLCICDLEMAVNIADDIVLVVLYDDRGGESLNALQDIFRDFPVNSLLANGALQPL